MMGVLMALGWLLLTLLKIAGVLLRHGAVAGRATGRAT